MMTTSRINNCYLPVLQSSENLINIAEQIKSENSSSYFSRGKPSKMLDSDNLERKYDHEKLVDKYVNNYANRESELDEKRQKIISDIDIINKHVTKKEVDIRNLKQSNTDLMKKNEKLGLMSEEFMRKYQDELKEKLEVVKDNQKLATRIQAMAKNDFGDDKKYAMLIATIKDKDIKIDTFKQMIEPLRKKVMEQESLKDALTLTNGEKKGLMEVNEEIVREIADLNDKHMQSIAEKDKKIAMLQQKSTLLLEETKRILAGGNNSELASDRRQMDQLKRSLVAEKIDVQEGQKSLLEEWKKIDESKKLIDEENTVIEDEKRIIDEEWGDIVRRKKEVSDSEKEVSEKVKELDEEWGDIVMQKKELSDTQKEITDKVNDLVEENDYSKKDKSVLELKLFKVIEELEKNKSELLHKSKEFNSRNHLVKKNEVYIGTLQTENMQIIAELKQKDSQIDEIKRKTEYLNINLMKSELKLKEDLSTKENEINELEKKIRKHEEVINHQKKEISLLDRNKSFPKEQSSSVSESVVGETVLIERLKSKVGLMKVNNKRRMSDEDDENCISSKKSKQYEEEPIEEVNVDQEKLLENEVKENGSDHDNPLEEVTDHEFPVSDDEPEEQPNSYTVIDSDSQVDVQNGEVEEQDTIGIDESSCDSTSVKEHILEVKPSVHLPVSSEKKIQSASDPAALKLITAMNDFESLIKTSRCQDTLKVKEILPAESTKENVPELEKANAFLKEHDLIKQVENSIGQTKIINIINTAKKSKSIRDVFNDSDDDETEDYLVIDEASSIEELVEKESHPTIKVRDIATICESKYKNAEGDIIIPTDSGDISVEISEQDEAVRKEAEVDINKLTSKVSDVVKLALGKFSYINDGIQADADLENLTVRFTKQFTGDITSSHLESNSSLSGVSMTRIHKTEIVDQIMIYFEIKKSVNMNLKKHLHPSSTKFVTLSIDLSNQFSKDIMESHRTMFNSIAGVALTPDNHQWIGNQINFKMSTK